MELSVKNQYFQIDGSELPKHSVTVEDQPLRYSRDWLTDELIGPVPKSFVFSLWEKGKWGILAIFIALPFIFYPLEVIEKAWVTSIFSFIACMLLSGGAPVAGGIVYIPALQLIGLSPKQCVAFCAAAQALGCGIFTPLNWLSKDPGIIVRSSLPFSLPSALLGLYLAIFQFPLDEKEVQLIFSCFSFFLLCSVVHGLFHSLTTQDEPMVFGWPTNLTQLFTILLYIISTVIGGMLAGWIGIGIEKVFFMLATSYHHTEVRRSTITGILLIGCLSLVSAYIHFFVLEDVPVPYWLCSLPGILLGTTVGPVVNAWLGSRNVMILFCSFLVINIVKEFTS